MIIPIEIYQIIRAALIAAACTCLSMILSRANQKDKTQPADPATRIITRAISMFAVAMTAPLMLFLIHLEAGPRDLHLTTMLIIILIVSGEVAWA